MRPSRHRFHLTLLSAVLALASACGDDDDSGGTGGMSGGGSGGKATGGTATGGSGGSAAMCTGCNAPANAVATCDNGTCGFSCNTGYLKCNSNAECCKPVITYIAATPAANHMCAVGSLGTVTGKVWCWGENADGEVGDGGTNDRVKPYEVIASGATQAGAGSPSGTGSSFSCALVSGGVKCWGANGEGQLGDNTTIAHTAPAFVTGLTSNATKLVVGGHACAIHGASDILSCWGWNNFGQIGNNTTADELTPYDTIASAVTTMAIGRFHMCAIASASDGLKCWGRMDGTTKGSQTPQDVSTLTSGVGGVAAGAFHTCAIVSGALKCFGVDDNGQLGNGATTGDQDAPVQAVASGVTAVAAGSRHTCVLLTGGSVKCWGNNLYGQLGNGTTSDLDAPPSTPVIASGVTAITAGISHTCALLTGGTIKCWGRNASGQLGDGSTMDRSTPVDVVF